MCLRAAVSTDSPSDFLLSLRFVDESDCVLDLRVVVVRGIVPHFGRDDEDGSRNAS